MGTDGAFTRWAGRGSRSTAYGWQLSASGSGTVEVTVPESTRPRGNGIVVHRRAGLAAPLTGRYVDGHRVDFYWPDLGLVVETDGLR